MSVALIARTLLPEPVRAPLRRAMIATRDFRRARRVLRRYSRHYRDARRHYAPRTGASPLLCPISALGVRTIRPDATPNVISLRPDFLDLVGRLQRDVSRRFTRTANCRFFPAPTATNLPADTEAVADVLLGETITLQLREYLDLDGLEALCAHLIPEIEHAIFGCHALVDKVYVYRSLVSRQRPQASWLWHFDEHPREVVKLLIYLTDVTDDTAPFTYLAAGETGEAVTGSRTPLYGRSRISDRTMAAYAARGYRPCAVTGGIGTMVLFNDNVIHRATLASRAHRDVVVLQMRPVEAPRVPFVDPRWTGSFQHVDFNRDPRQVEPQPWPRGYPS